MSSRKWYSKICEYLDGIEDGLPVLPETITALFPYRDPDIRVTAGTFYKKYYSDSEPRALILGINPGRHGAGLTGVPFTDPKRLSENCGIDSGLRSHEPSSEFVYRVIEAFGGAELFYQKFFISSVSPVGFIKEGKNFNYYDDKKFYSLINPYVVFQTERLLNLGFKNETVICLGEGKNYELLCQLNQAHQWFRKIYPLAHPRFVIQYKRRQLDDYIKKYLHTMSQIAGN